MCNPASHLLGHPQSGKNDAGRWAGLRLADSEGEFYQALMVNH